MEIRRFTAQDAEAASQMIAQTLRISNSSDYSPEQIEHLIGRMNPQMLTERAETGHMYVVSEENAVIGIGEIAPFWGSETESILLTVFVLPAFQGRGIGRMLIRTLEQDEYGLRASRIEIPASRTGLPFYLHLGYDYKNGVREPEDGLLYRLEKRF